MKAITTKGLLGLTLFLIFSCAPESVEDLDLAEELKTEGPAPADEPKANETPKNDVTAACDFQLSDFPQNTAIDINCTIDLEGAAIKLASGTILNYAGGDIVNGILEFEQGMIDGRLLRSSLVIKGTVQLTAPEFLFDPTRWEIVQGATDPANALKNRLDLEALMDRVKAMGATTFKIGAFDAFFDVVTVTSTTSNQNFYPTVEAINVPSDFSLVMGRETHLRVFPNASPKYTLLALREVTNSSIQGGTLHGDRDAHDYSAGGTHEWGNLLDLHAAQNCQVSGVTMKNGSGDGMKIHSLRFTFQENYLPSKNIVVTNCTFDNNRRNNLSITDGMDIRIEDCAFLNAGRESSNSEGIAPMFAIDVEAHRGKRNGEVIHYEKVDRVVIRNCTESNSMAGGFLIYSGDNVTIEENTVETGIAYSYATGSIIRNNTLKSKTGSGLAIKCGTGDTERIENNSVYGNMISGYRTGMIIYSQGHDIYDNTISDFETGIFVKNLSDSRIHGNILTSERPESRGFFAHLTSIDEVEFEGNKITTSGNPFKFASVNQATGQGSNTMLVSKNEFNSGVIATMLSTSGIFFKENTINTSTEIYDSSNYKFDGNVIDAGDRHGLFLRSENENVVLMNNEIDVVPGRNCIEIEQSTLLSEILREENTCL